MTKKAIRRDHHQTDLNRPKAHHKPSPTILMEMNDIAEYNNYKGSFNNNFHVICLLFIHGTIYFFMLEL